MRMIILAAGYATRLYPLTENFPKPLLDVKGKTILDHMLTDMDTNRMDEIIVVSNHKFYKHFQDWKSHSPWKDKMTIIDDGSTENDNRLGAVKDILFAINDRKLDDDVLVAAGDNLLDFSLDCFIDYFEQKNTTVVMRHREDDIAKLQRTGVALIDDEDEVVEMEEKPHIPKSNWAVPPFYIFRKQDLNLFALGLQDGCAYDAPGDFIAWLCRRTKVHAMLMPGGRYDIGTLESYRLIQ